MDARGNWTHWYHEVGDFQQEIICDLAKAMA